METVFKILTLIIILAVMSMVTSALRTASTELCGIGLMIFIPVCLITVLASLLSGSFSMGIMNALFTIAVTSGMGSLILFLIGTFLKLKGVKRR